MNEWMSNYVFPITVAITLALGAFGLKVYGYEVRIDRIEERVEKVEVIQQDVVQVATEVHNNQSRILYKLCLLVNDTQMAKCHIQ